MDWKQPLVYITGSLKEELFLRNKDLAAENRILHDLIQGRVQLTDVERKTLAQIGKKSSKKALRVERCLPVRSGFGRRALTRRCRERGGGGMTGNQQLRHVVMLGFKDGTTADETAEIVRRFARLKDLVPGIEAFEWGANNSSEGLNQGHSHCFFLTFVNAAARDAYVPHPDHVAFSNWVGQWAERVTVMDYWAQNEA